MHTPFLHPDNFGMVERQHWHELQQEADHWHLAREAGDLPVSSSESGGHSSVSQTFRRKFRESLTLPRLHGMPLLLRKS